MEVNSNYQASDVLNNMKEVFKNKKLFIVLLFIIQAGINILVSIVFKKNYSTLINAKNIKDSKELLEIFDIRFMLSILVIFIVSIIINGLLTKITYQEITDKKNNSSIITQFFHYFIMNVVLFLIIIIGLIVFGVVVTMFVLIPILGLIVAIFLILGMFILLFYYLGYYRFIPYIAMAEGIDDVFSKSKRSIKGHLALSIILIIFNSGLSEIFSRLEINTISNDKLVLLVVVIIISQIISFSLQFFDIAFVFTGLKHDYIRKQEILESNENPVDTDNSYRMGSLE